MSTEVKGFADYGPVNRQQEEFHASKARHKLLIGGYGGGKSYPAIHEFTFHCLENPGHHSVIMRNTWKDLEDQSWNDCIDIWEPAGIIKRKTHKPGDKLEVEFINGHLVMFKPLSSKRDNIKGYHVCQYYIDDPNVDRYHDIISFMMSRLRNPPHVKATRFQSIITANWEGRNWLWKTYMSGRNEGGDGEDIIEVYGPDGDKKMAPSGKAYWMCPTTDNPTLSENYIEDMAASHSKEWMDRFVFCKDVSKHSGLIYYMFDLGVHHRPREEVLKKEGLIFCLAVDVGGTHPTAVIELATDGTCIYVIGEWFKKDCKMSDLGGYLQDKKLTGRYRRFIIDPSSAKNEMTSKSSVKRDLHRNYNISFENGNNHVDLGLETIKDLFMNANNEVRLFIDAVNCPNSLREIEIYRWEEEKNMDLDDMTYKQKPRKTKDDCVDAMRYGIMYLVKYIKGRGAPRKSRIISDNNKNKRLNKLPYYRYNHKIREKQVLKNEYRSMGIPTKKINKILREL